MLTENTVNKLQEMKLTAMARAFKEQLNDPNINGLAFEDRFGLLVDQEWTSRKNNHLKRLIKQAKFSETGACVEDIEYHSDRNLDSAQITRLASCNYIAERHNILLLGATGKLFGFTRGGQCALDIYKYFVKLVALAVPADVLRLVVHRVVRSNDLHQVVGDLLRSEPEEDRDCDDEKNRHYNLQDHSGTTSFFFFLGALGLRNLSSRSSGTPNCSSFPFRWSLIYSGCSKCPSILYLPFTSSFFVIL